MRILYLGYPDNNIHNFLKTKGNVIQTMEKITEADVVDVDWIISYGYGHILKKNVLSRVNRPIINLHISYLPFNRGADPNIWSWIDNTPKGVTIHLIDGGIDAGDILAQQEVSFDENETLASSYNKLRDCIEKLFVNNFENIINNRILVHKQQGVGSSHTKKDLEAIKHLLTMGWDTPVKNLL